MLALTRKKGDSVFIGDDIEVVILSVQGEQVKLGFIAPKNVPIHRKEVYEQIKAENEEAAKLSNITAIQSLLKTNKEA